MSDKHPYTPATGHVVQVINHLRKSFPTVVNSDTLKKLGFAVNNESYVLNILRFLGFIDQDGNKCDPASKLFSIHDDTEFSNEFGKFVAKSYSDLFDLHGENTWELNTDALISFFRTSDETTALVGKLQASTFQLLAAFSGHGVVPEPKTAVSKSPSSGIKKSAAAIKPVSSIRTPSNGEKIDTQPSSTEKNNGKKKDIGLTVRIEINLPSDGDQQTYDRIFKSIRENLLDG